MSPQEHLIILEDLLKMYTGARYNEFEFPDDYEKWQKANASIEYLKKFIEEGNLSIVIGKTHNREAGTCESIGAAKYLNELK